MRRKKTILDVLREAQGQAEKKGHFKEQGKDLGLDSRAPTSSSGPAISKKGASANPPPSRETQKKEGVSPWAKFRVWLLAHPALGGGLSLALLFLLVFGVVKWEGSKASPDSPQAGQEKTSLDSSQKKDNFKPKPSGLENTPRLMGGGKLDSPIKTASNSPSIGKDGNRQGTGKLKPESWARRKLRFFRISSYKNPKKTVIGYASSMARYLRTRGFAAEHAWLKKKGGRQLIVFVRIPNGLPEGGEAKLFSRLRSLGFVKKPKDKTDDGFQFNFHKLVKNVGRASFRVRVGMGEKG